MTRYLFVLHSGPSACCCDFFSSYDAHTHIMNRLAGAKSERLSFRPKISRRRKTASRNANGWRRSTILAGPKSLEAMDGRSVMR